MLDFDDSPGDTLIKDFYWSSFFDLPCAKKDLNEVKGWGQHIMRRLRRVVQPIQHDLEDQLETFP